jgi:hypothetical protein
MSCGDDRFFGGVSMAGTGRARAKTTQDYDAEIRALRDERRKAKARIAEEYDRKIGQARARQKAARARESTAARKADAHAKIVAGGLLLSCFPDGWESVDWARLARQIRRAGPAFARMVVPEGERPKTTAEATARLREWEREDRLRQKDGG